MFFEIILKKRLLSIACENTPTLASLAIWLPVQMQCNNNNNKLYLHDHERELQHCKSILTITMARIRICPIAWLILAVSKTAKNKLVQLTSKTFQRF